MSDDRLVTSLWASALLLSILGGLVSIHCAATVPGLREAEVATCSTSLLVAPKLCLGRATANGTPCADCLARGCWDAEDGVYCVKETCETDRNCARR